MTAAMNPRITRWQGLRVWLVGASSGIGAALATELLARGARVAVSARSNQALAALATGQDSEMIALALDVGDADALAQAHRTLVSRWGSIDLTIWLAAAYEPMDSGNFQLEVAKRIARVNFEGLLNGLAVLLPAMRRERCGGLAIVSSVAGYRGLPRSPVYGPTKAALINLAESLYLELRPLGIGVYLINPGFVRTPLTSLNDFPMPAMIEPDEAARRILRGLERGRFEIHFPARLSWAMKALSV
ncbi:MAG: SDR family NAD(P)-dependent oxidoreductase, partial [Quisquiliibacterium sp.]